MEIRPLDARDPAAMAAWHATYHAAHVYGLAHPSPWMLEEMRAEFLGERTGERTEPFAGYVDGRLVTAGVVELPQLDNRTVARVDVATHPQARRRGHGTAMLEHLTDGRGRAGPRPAERRGGLGPRRARRRRRHPGRGVPDPARLRALPRRREADPGPAGRRHRAGRPGAADRGGARGLHAAALRGAGARGPPRRLRGAGRVAGRPRRRPATSTSSRRSSTPPGSGPTSGSSRRPAARKYTTVAIAPDGEVVAYSELAVPTYDPERVYQWGTLVRREHRGHRLGLATKVHNLRRFQDAGDRPHDGPHLERRGQPPHDRGQRDARLPPGRPARGVPEAALSDDRRDPPAAGTRRAGSRLHTEGGCAAPHARAELLWSLAPAPSSLGAGR